VRWIISIEKENYMPLENVMKTTIRDRLLSIIEREIPARKRFKDMEEISGISAQNWADMSRDRQRPTAAMIEFVAKKWPDYAYWLACGDSEPEYGNYAPKTAACMYLCRGEPKEWRTKERLYKQKFLDENFGVSLLQNSVEIDEQIMIARDTPKEGKAYLWLEKIIKGFGEVLRPDLGILESDAELMKIRINSMKEAIQMLTETQVQRQNYATFKKMSPKLSKVFDALAKITK